MSIVNDPKLTPRVKHLMVTALMAKVKFIDDELGQLVYADRSIWKRCSTIHKDQETSPHAWNTNIVGFGLPSSC